MCVPQGKAKQHAFYVISRKDGGKNLPGAFIQKKTKGEGGEQVGNGLFSTPIGCFEIQFSGVDVTSESR